MITCIIIEDQPPAQRLLKKYITDYGKLFLKGTFSDALEAMNFLQNEAIDLIFLDIHLPKLSGLNFLKILNNKPAVILTTAFPDYALESYEYDVTDYLLKPYSFDRFVQAVSKIASKQDNKGFTKPENTTNETLTHIFIKSGYEHIKIELDHINFIKSDTDYTEIHLENKKYLSYESLTHWNETLPEKDFIRVHKSYIINFLKVEKVVSGYVILSNATKIPVGRAFKNDLMERITQ